MPEDENIVVEETCEISNIPNMTNEELKEWVKQQQEQTDQ